MFAMQAGNTALHTWMERPARVSKYVEDIARYLWGVYRCRVGLGLTDMTMFDVHLEKGMSICAVAFSTTIHYCFMVY